VPLLVPRSLNTPPAAYGHGLAQLGFRLRYATTPGDYVTGALYDVVGLPPSSFAARFPIGRQAGTQLFTWLAAALMVATVYFPGRWSDNAISMRRDGETTRMRIRGGTAPGFDALRRDVTARLRHIWRRLGAWPLPGATLATPGMDAHFGGVFPMGGQGPGATNTHGELRVAPRLHIVDGSVLPTVPAKSTTLTIMANADRIGRALAELR
jgi:choline dehydrogenase-like flavoprotein